MNLVLITSLLNPINKELSYCSTRSIYTTDERFKQTIRSIESIKKYIPNCYIILLECSINIKQYELMLKEHVNEYFNYCENQDIISAVNSKYKGYGESTVLLNYFLEYNPIHQFNNIFKLSGRYMLNESFDYNLFKNNENIFKSVNSANVVSTRLFKINIQYLKEFIDILRKTIEYTKNGISIEHIFYKLIKFKHVNVLGVCGYISVNGDYINE